MYYSIFESGEFNDWYTNWSGAMQLEFRKHKFMSPDALHNAYQPTAKPYIINQPFTPIDNYLYIRECPHN